MSTTDQPGHGSRDPGHEAGEYEDKDVADVRATPPEGEYTDRDVPATGAPDPDDEGSFVDRDVVSEHRLVEAEGAYTDSEVDGEDVEATQVARAAETHGSPVDPDPAGADEPPSTAST